MFRFRNSYSGHQDGHATRDPEGPGAGPRPRGHRAQAVQDADAGSEQPAQQQPRQAPDGHKGDPRHGRPDLRQRRRTRQRRVRRHPVVQHRRRRQLVAELVRPRRQPHAGLRHLEGSGRPVSLRPALVERDLQNVARAVSRIHSNEICRSSTGSCFHRSQRNKTKQREVIVNNENPDSVM